MLASEGLALGYEIGGDSLENAPAAVVTGARAEIDDVIGNSDHLRIVTNPIRSAPSTLQRRLVTSSRSPEPWPIAVPLGFG
ncbi:MAG: hypothetical protein M3173_08790, partial [Chloroflexota bacterium]|nr:hypothetical protein [Chloroflexota bacterium]